MNKKETEHERLRRLIERFLAGELNEEETRQLERWLLDDKSARQLYYQCVDLDIGLRTLLPFAAGASRKRDRAAILNILPSTDPWWRTASLTAIGLGLLLVIAVSLMVLRSRPESRSDSAQTRTRLAESESATLAESSQAAVQLIGSVDVEFLRESLAQVGSTLKLNKDYAITSGMLEARFPTGAEVILEGPADFRVERIDCLVVRQGKCSVYAPAGAEGFQVLTPNTEVTDRGTRFTVSVNEAGDTNVQVVEGLAEVRSKESMSGTPIELRASQAQQFTGRPGRATSSLPFEASEYKPSLPDRIISYDAELDEQGRARVLRSLKVQRNRETHEYLVDELIPIELIHFRATRNAYNVLVLPGQINDRTSTLESDAVLVSGLINFGGSKVPLTTSPVVESQAGTTTPGMAFRFREPVKNCPGPDVVLMEVQSIIDPVDGDAFHVSPLEFRPGLRAHTIAKYDITMKSPQAVPATDFELIIFGGPCNSLERVLGERYRVSRPTTRFWVLAVGIDLSNLGVATGDTVDSLFLQDADDDNHEIDPIFIAGLPPCDP